MKKANKVVSVILAASSTLAMAACGGVDPSIQSSPDRPVDRTKAQLYVFSYDGGQGNAWLDAAVNRFETMYAETVFVEGTKGVQVHLDLQKQGGETVAATIPSSRNQVYFLENLNYLNYVYEGLMLDITDMVTEDLTAYGETRSIEDKLTTHQQNYYKVNNRYYGLPHYQGFNGLSYDVDLFDQKNLFFKNDGTIGAKSTSSNLSVGVDGVAGTFDDGLPMTYAQFFQLCDRMVALGICPLTWSGYYQFYFQSLMVSLATDHAAEEAITFYTFDGKSKELIDSIAEDGTITYKPETTITQANGYELYNHASIWYALDFAETVIEKGYFSPGSFNGTTTHTDAQDTFLLSRYTNEQDVGMLVEGSWWQSEAESTFAMMANSYVNASKNDRRIGFMPLPKATEERLAEHKTYIRDDNYTIRFINANCEPEYIPLAKKFLQFCATDESLQEFTTLTSAMLGYEYDLKQEQYDSLNYFGQSIYNLRKSSTVVYPYSNSDFFYRNKSALSDFFGTGVYNVVTLAMKNNGISAKTYFDAIVEYHDKDYWDMMK